MIQCGFTAAQLFNRDTTAIFIVALMGMYQQARGQVSVFGGTKYIFRGKKFVFIVCLKQTVT